MRAFWLAGLAASPAVVVPVIFGGCRWGRQHRFVELELGLFQRAPENVTSWLCFGGGPAPVRRPSVLLQREWRRCLLG